MRNICVQVRAPWGPMLVSLNDHHRIGDWIYGVGYDLIENGDFSPDTRRNVQILLSGCRQAGGDGVVVVDAGANIGALAVPWGLHMMGWGTVHAFEPQPFVYRMLVTNVMLNNAHNVHTVDEALGMTSGTTLLHSMDPRKPGSLGSVSIRDELNDTGQSVENRVPVTITTIDAMELDRLDLLKIDVEGMELDVLEGARDTIMRCRPIIFAEVMKVGALERMRRLNVKSGSPAELFDAGIGLEDAISTGQELISQRLAGFGYDKIRSFGVNCLAYRSDSNAMNRVRVEEIKT